MKFNYAKTYYYPVKRSGVLGLKTTVVFSDGTKQVSEDFFKEGRKMAQQLQNQKGGIR